MILSGKFVLISVESRESNGKTYYNANMESVEDGKLFRWGATETAVDKMKKYQTYLGHFEPRVWDGKLSLTLLDVDALPPEK